MATSAGQPVAAERVVRIDAQRATSGTHGVRRQALRCIPRSGEDLGGRFLGRPAYLDLKDEGNTSIAGKRGRLEASRAGVASSRHMAKAGLLEAQSPAVRSQSG
jgi:hypothetical protein